MTVEPSAEYWATLAQVVPVIALALSVQGRAMYRQSRRAPQLLRSILTLAWATTLIGLAVVEAACLAALRGQQPADHWTEVAEWSVGIGLALLVAQPAALTLLAMHASPLSRWLTWRPVARLVVRREMGRTHRAMVTGLRLAHEAREALASELQRTADDVWRILEKELEFAQELRMDPEPTSLVAIARREHRTLLVEEMRCDRSATNCWTSSGSARRNCGILRMS